MDTIDVYNGLNSLAATVGDDISLLNSEISQLQAGASKASTDISSLQSASIANTQNGSQNTTAITALQASIGALVNLETTDKSSVVNAINEVITEFMAFTQIDDTALAGVTNRTWSVDKIIAQMTALKNDLIGNNAGAWDTLTKLTAELANDESAINQLLTAVGTKLTAANNLSDLTNASVARTNLGLGTAATRDTGTGGGQIPVLDAGGKLPSLDGSQLSGVSAVKLSVARNIGLSGDVTGSASFDGSGGVTISSTLANSGATAGTYGDNTHVAIPTIDAKGRVTGVSVAAIRQGSTTQTGLVSLLDSVASTDTTTAAVPKSVKTAYDLANSANNTALASVPAIQKASPNGVATLDATGLIPNAQIPSLDWVKITTGKPTTLAGYGITDAVLASSVGVANGLATLDAGGKVPAAQLPSYVDDVLEYANLAAFPATGESAKIYVADDTNKTYRWSGTAYVEISASPGSTDAVPEGTSNLYFTNARAQAAVTSVTGNAGTATKLATARTISLTGAATGSGSFDGSANLSVALTLANSGVTAGTYGDSVTVPSVTLDAKGRVTAATAQAIRAGSLTQTGLVQLNSSVSSTDTATASTPSAVKQAYDLATTANTTANASVPSASVGAASGVAPLDANGLLPAANVPGLDWSKITTGKPTTLSGYGIADAMLASARGTASGVAPLDSSSMVPVANIPNLSWAKITTGKPTTLSGYGITDALASSLKGAANGVASLDSTGKVPSAQLPSFVDDVLEYTSLSAFPATGESNKIYVADDTNKTYRWSGSAYIEISPSPGSTDSVTEGATNLYFTAARAQAAVTSVTGNAGTATKLATARTLSFTGAATGSGSFDGSANLSIALTLQGFDWSKITSGKPTTLAGYGITDAVSSSLVAAPNGLATLDASSLLPLAQLPNHDWSKITTGKPTTLSGYGITDAITTSAKGASNGVASLDASALIPVAQLPTVAAQTNKTQNWTKSQAGAIVPLTWASSLAIDMGSSNNFSVTLAGATTLATPTNVTPGQSGAIRVTQDSTGSRTMAYSSVFKFASGTAPVLTTTAGATDVLCYYVLSATEILMSLVGNVK